MNVAIGKTVVPYKTPGTECITSREYYIWRTMQDGKVRKSHRDYDGKIFNVNNPPIAGYPGDDYNCRCYADFEIPYYIEIEDTDRVIRKYIVDLNLLPNFCVK